MLETFAGPPGLFLKGLKYDLPNSTIKQIKAKGKHLWKKTVAPWNDAGIVPDLREPEQPADNSPEQPPVPDEVTSVE
jgi:hypothetical protein